MSFDPAWRESCDQSCFVCRHPRFVEHREAWGCDGPTEEAWGAIECHVCIDEARTAYRQTCTTCDGTGQLDLHECPNRMVGAYEAAMVRYATLLDKGIWPFEVQPSDCPASLVDSIVAILSTKVRIEEETLERERAKLRR